MALPSTSAPDRPGRVLGCTCKSASSVEWHRLAAPTFAASQINGAAAPEAQESSLCKDASVGFDQDHGASRLDQLTDLLNF
ncbi:hypothetical protein BWR17_08565 [Phaeobacter inhibens]|nr:hypothetical protein BWR17_08565 [Phaeobacter inhibens]